MSDLDYQRQSLKATKAALIGKIDSEMARTGLLTTYSPLRYAAKEVSQGDAEHAGNEPKVEDGDVTLATLDGANEGAV